MDKKFEGLIDGTHVMIQDGVADKFQPLVHRIRDAIRAVEKEAIQCIKPTSWRVPLQHTTHNTQPMDSTQSAD